MSDTNGGAGFESESPQEQVNGLKSSIDQLEQQIDALIGSNDESRTVDSIADGLTGPNRAKPYGAAAYSLTSALFAYLKSEGQDTDILKPELVRVQDRLGKLDKRLSDN